MVHLLIVFLSFESYGMDGLNIGAFGDLVGYVNSPGWGNEQYFTTLSVIVFARKFLLWLLVVFLMRLLKSEYICVFWPTDIVYMRKCDSG